ncbi:MAG: UDP-N-acetylglucosamine 2-epimerase (non-hydrolyzing) [Candidatus Syntrophonatronum acetioxidans]|uniref:UDP-N-acetylglucosamine 2-epimerase (non-hydrolyzing) n=1 Tax=Candidatus Syntrophonatronum acetioxidans TaxID=1795816 RepID=A0A424YFV4_9FIRM|nr:MAG: UDP-N-acetylglucosamine 2-epimerase (non-hydrolyzing) [Candidatus Syntrophonatronum acetioxidans]
MDNIKVLSIFGTRPEAIKMAPLVKVLKETPGVESRLCVTAQHREMLDQVLKLFNLAPQEDLNIMKDRQSLSGITCRALEGLEKILLKDKPHLVLVHGDTTTTFAGSLAAFYQQVKVGHVEAGLRTFQKYSPFPEEMNRKLAGVLADLHFAPTEGAAQNLREEGVDPRSIFVTGNTVIDALQTTVGEDHYFDEEKLNHLDYENQRVILVEAHRRENLGQPLEEICQALVDLVEDFPDTCLVFPVHKNPVVRETVLKYLKDRDRVYLLEPLGTGDFHNLIARSYLLLTDSGGIQEEAPSLGKPVLVLREHTERPEAVERGTVRLVGRDRNRVYQGAARLLQDQEDYLGMARAVNPYGDGKASARIRDILLHSFGRSSHLPPPFNP